MITTMVNQMETWVANLKLMDMIIQCCYSYCFPTSGKPEEWLNFLATHVLHYQIVVFPPLSVCWWATHKRIRNEQMKQLMFPKCTVQVTKTKGFTNKTVKQLKETLDVDTTELKTNVFVLKANIGCGGATVWRITFCGNKEWKSCLIAGNLKNWPEPGIYEGERWLPTAPKEEQHTFATFVKRAQILYSAPTSAGPD
jgi:hypothetical protein